MAWGVCPPPDYGQAEDQGVFCWWGVIKGKAKFWKQGIKSNSVILNFSNLNNKFTEERERFLNSISDIPPPPFHVGDIVVRQPIEQEIYQKQIDSWEQSVLLGYGSVNEYIYRQQYWEANDLDDIMFEEFDMHIYDRMEKVFLKWREGTDGAGEIEKERQEDVKMEYCRVCKNVQHQVWLWTRQMEIKCFHKERQQWRRDEITAISIKRSWQ